MDGIWESIGYGNVLEIIGTKYAFYEVSNISCLPNQTGNIKTLHEITIINDTMTLSMGVGVYQYKKIDSLPYLCNQKITSRKKEDPIYNFEVMAATIKKHFAYFERNKINWDSLYTTSRNKISSKSSAVELYVVLEEVINGLKDNHGYLEAPDSISERAEKQKTQAKEFQDTPHLKEYGDFEIAQLVASSYLDEELTRNTWLMQWGKMANNVGYLQVKSMWLYADLNLTDSLVKKYGFVNSYVDTFTKMNEAEYIQKEKQGVALLLDIIMSDLKETTYLILDVRFNGGGHDAVSLEILRRFNEEKRIVASKKAIHKKGFTKEIPIFLDSSTAAYTNPVYLLTSRQSASATDFLTLASLELPHFSRIGSRTSGALSDALEKRLPNGWYFSISNEIYFDRQGICYESIGIPPDIELNYAEDRQTFFRDIANDLEIDKQDILEEIEKMQIK